MSRQAKIIIYSLILVFSIYKTSDSGYFFDSFIDKVKTNRESFEKAKKNQKPKKNRTNVDTGNLPIRDKSIPKSKEKKWDYNNEDYLSVPKTGHSPYDRYFGKGIYNDTNNYIEVLAPSKTHVVFIVIDVYSGRRIRNEFIRKGEKFKMTKIPFGTYDYMYFTGRNWDKNALINNGKIKGGFKDYQSFNKNQINKDRMEFERGYYGGYQIKLTQTIGGNLKTKSTSAEDFFD
jgi:hypothetical protein